MKRKYLLKLIELCHDDTNVYQITQIDNQIDTYQMVYE